MIHLRVSKLCLLLACRIQSSETTLASNRTNPSGFFGAELSGIATPNLAIMRRGGDVLTSHLLFQNLFESSMAQCFFGHFGVSSFNGFSMSAMLRQFETNNARGTLLQGNLNPNTALLNPVIATSAVAQDGTTVVQLRVT